MKPQRPITMKAKASITEHRRNLLERFRRSLQIVFLTVYSISAMAEGNEGWHFTPRPPVADDSAEILDRQDEPVPCEGTENDGGDEIAELPTQEIRELAYGLENSPLKIFNYVRDTIEYVHYFGAKKGAQLTLLEKSGNDFDQCALLVALLRQAATNVGGGFSARYQFGAMKVPYESLTGDNLKDWMGFSLSVSETNDDEIFQMVNSFNYQRGYPLLDNIDLYCYRPENLDYEFVFQRIWVELT